MADSAKDLSTTALGLMAAYFLAGAIVLGAYTWCRPDVRSFFLENGVHFSFAAVASLTIGLMLNALRIAVFSRWLFKDISYAEEDYKDFDEDIINRLQTAVDEVFRLHQFYSGVFFVLPVAAIWWLVMNYQRILGENTTSWPKSTV